MLRDSFGRTFPYIRLSITDVCNFKCGYCLPNGYMPDKSDNRKFLHLEEIRRLAIVLSRLGVSKIRLTGGEPTVRKDFFEIIKVLKNDWNVDTIKNARVKQMVNDVIHFVENNPYKHTEKVKLLEVTKMFDTVRNENWKIIFPELYTLFCKHLIPYK